MQKHIIVVCRKALLHKRFDCAFCFQSKQARLALGAGGAMHTDVPEGNPAVVVFLVAPTQWCVVRTKDCLLAARQGCECC